jgi:8-oxo-dGTP pyrophosphatase MutT (NUDIX family)
MGVCVRALLLDENDNLVVFRRDVPGRGVYWSAPGGKVDPGETDEEALRRELFEELGATVGEVRYLFTAPADPPAWQNTHRFFVTRLVSMDLSQRTGEEFHDPGKGTYDVELIPCDPTALKAFRLVPDKLARYLDEHAGSLPALAG